MKKIKILKLNQLNKHDLSKKEMNVLHGGYSCACICACDPSEWGWLFPSEDDKEGEYLSNLWSPGIVCS